LVDPSIVEIERRLDIINLRVELTRALHAEAITTFAPAVVEIQLDEDLTVAPEA
jgi:hypothetical protein